MLRSRGGPLATRDRSARRSVPARTARPKRERRTGAAGAFEARSAREEPQDAAGKCVRPRWFRAGAAVPGRARTQSGLPRMQTHQDRVHHWNRPGTANGGAVHHPDPAARHMPQRASMCAAPPQFVRCGAIGLGQPARTRGLIRRLACPESAAGPRTDRQSIFGAREPDLAIDPIPRGDRPCCAGCRAGPARGLSATATPPLPNMPRQRERPTHRREGEGSRICVMGPRPAQDRAETARELARESPH